MRRLATLLVAASTMLAGCGPAPGYIFESNMPDHIRYVRYLGLAEKNLVEGTEYVTKAEGFYNGKDEEVSKAKDHIGKATELSAD